MPKIMLVEDDNNLREIYGERLLAEGYEIVSASDGEEALALAVKERPDLIISDVMMPKISGFDMLDILRQTPETKNTKIIMMTALSQLEDKDRANKLGADKYLVKSQVTLEDVARVVHDILYGADPNIANPQAAAPTAAAQMPPVVAPTPSTPSQQPIAAPFSVAPEQPLSTNPPASEPSMVTPTAPEPSFNSSVASTSAAGVVPTVPTPTPVPPSAPLTPLQPIAANPITTSSAPIDSSPIPSPVVTVPSTPAMPEPAPASVALPAQPTAPPSTTNPISGEVPPAQPHPTLDAPEPSTTHTNIVSQAALAAQPTVKPDPIGVQPAVSPVQPASVPSPSLPDNLEPQTAEQEVAAVAKQIESFLNTESTAEVATHEEPLVEPATDAAAAMAAIMTPPSTTNTLPVVPEEPVVSPPVSATAPETTPNATNPSVPNLQDVSGSDVPELASARKKIIAPIHETEEAPNIYQLYEKEMAAEAANSQAPEETGPIVATPTNPIAEGADSTPPPLETFDPTSLGGVQLEDDKNTTNASTGSAPDQNASASSPATPTPAAAAGGAPVGSPAPVATPAVVAAPTTASATPDPNQIAL